MTDRLTKLLPLLGALALGVSLQACTSGGFTDEGSEQQEPIAAEGGLAKSLLISMGAIDDPHAAAAPKYQPRPALVVPPQNTQATLPVPVDQDAALAAKGFPVDPEVRAEKERQARLSGTGTTTGGNVNNLGNGTMSPSDQARFKDLPVAGAPGSAQGPHYEERQASAPLKPWELDGKAQAEAVSKLQDTGPQARERSLLAPPADYRTPSDKAPLESPPTGLAAMKPGWWPF